MNFENYFLGLWFSLGIFFIGLNVSPLQAKEKSSEELIKIQKIQKTEYQRIQPVAEREASYLSNHYRQEEFDLDVLPINPQVTNEVVSGETNAEYAAYLEYGLGHYLRSWLEFKKVSHFNYFWHRLFWLNRPGIFSLGSGGTNIGHSSLDRLDYDFKFTSQLGKHRLWTYVRSFNMGLQAHSLDDSVRYFYVKHLSLGMQYDLKQSFSPLVIEGGGKFLIGYHDMVTPLDSSQFYELNGYLKLIPRRILSGFSFQFLYESDFLVNRSFSRHLGQFEIQYLYYFSRQAFLDLGISSSITYSQSDQQEINFYSPFFVLPKFIFTLEWNKSLSSKLYALLKLEKESYQEFFYSLVTVNNTHLPRLKRMGQAGIDFTYAESWVEGSLSGIYDFYFTSDQVRVDSNHQRYLVRKQQDQSVGLIAQLNVTPFDWTEISSRLEYRFSSRPDLFPVLLSENEIGLNFPNLYSFFSIQFNYTQHSYLMTPNGFLSLDQEVVGLKYEFKYSPNLSFQMRVENLWGSRVDREHLMVEGGRNLFLGVKYLF